MSKVAELKVGLLGEADLVVTANDTAASQRSGLVPAFSTPRMIALAERASVAAVNEYLKPGETSVGVEVNVKHLAATPVGMAVRAKAQLVEINGRRLVFNVEVWDDKEKIGEGSHVRAIVDKARFEQRLQEKAGTLDR